MAAAVDGGDDDGKNPPAALRCIDAVRYTVALVVTVLIVSVIVNSIKFVLRSDPLYVSVVGGFVSTTNISSPGDRTLSLDLNVRAQNPSGRVRMYYFDITAYFFDSNTSASTTTDPEFDSMVYATSEYISDIVVAQHWAVDSFVHVVATNESMPVYFDSLYGGGRMSGVTLRLDGTLSSEVYGKNKTLPTTYYCEKLLLGGSKDDEAFKGIPDVICRAEHRGTH